MPFQGLLVRLRSLIDSNSTLMRLNHSLFIEMWNFSTWIGQQTMWQGGGLNDASLIAPSM